MNQLKRNTESAAPTPIATILSKDATFDGLDTSAGSRAATIPGRGISLTDGEKWFKSALHGLPANAGVVVQECLYL